MRKMRFRDSIRNTHTAALLSVTAAVLLIAACSPGAPTADEPLQPAGTDIASEGLNLPQQETLTPDSSGGGTPLEAMSAPISGVDPCALLTTAEVEAAFGEPLESAERETIFAYESCNFQSQSGSKFIILQLTRQNAEQFQRDNEETSAMFEAELTPISGLGDDAAFYSGLLRVRVGESVLQIATWHTDAEQEQALSMTQELALLALERLP